MVPFIFIAIAGSEGLQQGRPHVLLDQNLPASAFSSHIDSDQAGLLKVHNG